jgi:hypothetical protein
MVTNNLTPEQASASAALDAERRQKLMSMGLDPDKSPEAIQQRAREALGLPPPAPLPTSSDAALSSGNSGYADAGVPEGTPDYMRPIPAPEKTSSPVSAPVKKPAGAPQDLAKIAGKLGFQLTPENEKVLGGTLSNMKPNKKATKKEAPAPTEPVTDAASEARSLGLSLTPENEKALTGQKLQDPNARPAGSPYTYGSINKYKSGMDKQEQAKTEELQNQAAGAQQKADAYTETQNKLIGLQKESEALAVRQQQEQQAAQARIAALQEERKNFKINPSRIFKSDNALQLAMIGLSTALGFIGNSIQIQAVSKALAGNPNSPALQAQLQQLSSEKNPGLEAMDRAINRDIEAQKFEYEKLGDSEGAENNLYGKMLQLHGNERDAKQAMRGFYQDSLGMKMQEIGARTQNKTFINNAKDLQGQFQKEQSAWQMQQIEKPAFEFKQKQDAIARQQQQAAAALKRQEQKEANELAFKYAELGIKQQEADAKGKGKGDAALNNYSKDLGGVVHASTDAAADRIRTTGSATVRVREVNNKIISILENSKWLTPTDIGTLEGLFSEKSKIIADVRQHGQQTKDELWLDIGEKPYDVDKETGKTSYATSNFMPGKIIASLKRGNIEAGNVLKQMQREGNVTPARMVQGPDGAYSIENTSDPLPDPNFDSEADQ